MVEQLANSLVSLENDVADPIQEFLYSNILQKHSGGVQRWKHVHVTRAVQLICF